jgi:hypothetical protein
VASGSAWIELGQTEDTVPASLDVALQPSGLTLLAKAAGLIDGETGAFDVIP